MSATAIHEPAVDADFVIRVDLADHGMPGRSEQLWAKKVGRTRFILRSLPFFPYGIRPCDEVETDEQFTIRRVVRASGHQLLRVAATRSTAVHVHAELHPILEELALDHEWHGVGYVAVDLVEAKIPEALQAFLDAKAAAADLKYELA